MHVSNRMYLDVIKKAILTIILFGTSFSYAEKSMHIYMNNFYEGDFCMYVYLNGPFLLDFSFQLRFTPKCITCVFFW